MRDGEEFAELFNIFSWTTSITLFESFMIIKIRWSHYYHHKMIVMLLLYWIILDNTWLYFPYFVCTLRLPELTISDHDNQNKMITLLSYHYYYLLYLIVLDYTCLILCLYFAIACSAAQLEAFTCRSLLIIIGNCWH